MDKHLLTEIQIKDFKCFKDFKAEGFKRVNLIGGKNNVGKTAFMEACYVNVSSVDVNKAWTVLSSIKYSRDNLEYIGKILTLQDAKNDFDSIVTFTSKSNINMFKFDLLESNGKKEYKFIINDKEVLVNINDFSYTLENKKPKISK